MVDLAPRTRCHSFVAVIAAPALAGCGSALASAPPRRSPPSPPLALTSPEAVGSPSGSIVPWINATRTPIPSPTPVAIPPGTAACAPNDLTATAGWQGATGQMVGWLALTNVGQRLCVVNGSPRLIWLRSNTTILAPLTYQAGQDAGPGSSTGAAGPVLLRPGDQAGAFLWWTNCQRGSKMLGGRVSPARSRAISRPPWIDGRNPTPLQPRL